MTGYLLKSLYRKINPQFDSETNQSVEDELAKDLRKRGFGVWAGHLDQSSSE